MKRKITLAILPLLIAAFCMLIYSCNKKESIKNEETTSYSNLYSKGGVVHNELLSAFADKLLKKTNYRPN
ncbi:MAG: hypothetical protein QM640_17155 [Niabella sp.]